jgi:hypothetical protein
MSEYGIYPNSTPEFRMFQKEDGAMVMQVRYICLPQGYTGKWMDVKTEKTNDTNSQSSTSSNV